MNRWTVRDEIVKVFILAQTIEVELGQQTAKKKGKERGKTDLYRHKGEGSEDNMARRWCTLLFGAGSPSLR